MRLKSILQNANSRTVQRLIRRFGSYRRLVIALASKHRYRLNKALYLLKHTWLVRYKLRYHPLSLALAVKYDCYTTVQLLLNIINITSSTNLNYPLVVAVDNTNNVKLIQLLLYRGADPNYKFPDNRRWTPLTVVCRSYTTKPMIQFLIQAGADVNNVNCDGYSPLCVAIGWANYKIISLLVHAGADPNIGRRRGGLTALASLIQFGPLLNTYVLTLLRAGADPHIRDDQGKTAFDIARDKEVDLVELLNTV